MKVSFIIHPPPLKIDFNFSLFIFDLQSRLLTHGKA